VTDLMVFVRPAAGDLHLGPGAAAVLGKVRRLPDCPLDLDGDRRHERTDVGADEFDARQKSSKPRR
jgi:hypothetical protein